MFTLIKFLQYLYNKFFIVIDIEKYNKIMIKIDDYIILNKEDIYFINTLPNDKLMHIIKIYNVSYTQTIQELLTD